MRQKAFSGTINMSRSKGFSSFDAMFSLVPVVMMLLFVMELSSYLAFTVAETAHRQQLFNKLVSVADYTVKTGAVRIVDSAKYPNWLDEGKIDEPYVDGLRKDAGLSRLMISLQEPQEDFSFCIYRLVVVGEDKQMKRLFVCGE